MKASVIICSRNRVDSLLETLDSLAAMVVPSEIHWEILVVDNSSNDGTAQRVREWARRSKTPVVVLEEPRPGKSHALNRALTKARGEFLLFTDDDALLDPGWLCAALHSLEESGADCVGGRVLPLWLAPRPAWLSDRVINVLAMLDLGSEPRELTADDRALLYGVNYAFRREVFPRVGVFDTGVYARGCGSEDCEMVRRVQVTGGRVMYDPRMVVQHKVFPERVTRAYFRRWYAFHGRDRAERALPNSRRVLGLEGYMLRNFGTTLGRLLAAAVRGDADEFFHHELNSRLYLAYIRSRLGQFLSGKMPASISPGSMTPRVH